MDRTCPRCQSPILATQRFCRYCGHRLDDAHQQYVETRPYEQFTPPGTKTADQPAFYPSWSPAVGAHTTPLIVGRRSKVFHRLFVMLLLCAVGIGLGRFLLHKVTWPSVQIGEDVAGEIPNNSMAPVPLPRPAPASPSSPSRPPAPPTLSQVSGIEIQHRISKLLAEQAAQTQREIEQLQRRLERERGMSDPERESLLHQIEALQQERLGVLTATDALSSAALQNLLHNVASTEDILKSVEAELRRHNIKINLREVRVRSNEK